MTKDYALGKETGNGTASRVSGRACRDRPLSKSVSAGGCTELCIEGISSVARKAQRARGRKDELALQRQESGTGVHMKGLALTKQSTPLDTGRSIKVNLVIRGSQQNWDIREE